MKNMVFNNTARDVANYLMQRENQFLVNFSSDGIIHRSSYNGLGSHYKCALTDFKVKEPIFYRIHLFVDQNLVRVLIPKRTYMVYLKYVKNNVTTLPYQFTFKEELLEFSLEFEKYKNNFQAASAFVDQEITSLFQFEVTRIFEGMVSDDKKAWILECDDILPACQFKQIHAI